MEFELPALPEKDFFTMGEASRIVQLPAHTLRYWEERVGLKPARRSSGHRRYTRVDLENILFVKEMIQRRKMTVAGARRAMLDWRRGVRSSAVVPAGAGGPQGAALKLLREVRQELKALVQELR